MQYNEKKATHVAAFFLSQADGRMQILKLMKLMYLSERASFESLGEPMIGDRLVSMDHGPVLSRTLDHMNRLIPSDKWDELIGSREDHYLALKKNIKNPYTELGLLSEAETKILDSVWTKFGKLNGFDLANLTHEICPEWEDPKGSALAIPHMRLLRFLGYSADTAAELDKRFDCQETIDSVFSRPV